MKRLRKAKGFRRVWLLLGVFVLPIWAGAATGNFYPSYAARVNSFETHDSGIY
jgi:hypothetical protein